VGWCGGVAVAVAVGVALGVTLGVTVGVALGVTVGLGVGVAHGGISYVRDTFCTGAGLAQKSCVKNPAPELPCTPDT
jgi:hypothetical protein